MPARQRAADVFQADAIDRAYRNAALAPGAIRLYDRVHELVAAENCIGRAGFDAQRAAYAPVLINHGQHAGPFAAVDRIQRHNGTPRDGREPLDTLQAARWALIDLCLAVGDGTGVGSAVGVATARALRLRQCSVDALEKVDIGEGSHALIVSASRRCCDLASVLVPRAVRIQT